MTTRASWLPDADATFPEVLAAHVERRPDEVAYTALSARGRTMRPRPVRFEELWSSARRAAAVLFDRGVGAGDRVMLSLDRTETFLSYFLGAQALGAIPVPLPAMSLLEPPRSFRERMAAVALDCDPAAIVVDSARSWSALSAAVGAGVEGIVSDGTEASQATDPSRIPWWTNPSGARIALLQYTSGSTGRPKGVVVEHRNLVANFRASAVAADFGPDEVSVSWLPLYHDMGIVGGLLLGLWMRTGTVVMPPRAFLLQPESWLWAIHHHRATFTVGPNFAYNLVARKVSDRALSGLDLSSLRLAFDGAEPIDEATIEAFTRRFAAHGLRRDVFYPVYGLAECTLAVAFPRAGSSVRVDRVDPVVLVSEGRAEPVSAREDGTAYVSVGRAIPSHQVRIREVGGDADLGERVVGEICVTGPSCTPGYWGRPARGDEVRTGDLGYLADGDLFVIDRLKDLVIIAGRNYAPSDIERAATEVDGVAAGGAVAFAVPGDDGTEEMCVVVSVRATSWRSCAELQRDVERAVHATTGVLPRHVVVVPPGALPKTSSGKLRRQACRAAFLARELPSARGVAQRTGIKVARVRKELVRLVAGQRESNLPPPP